MDSDNTIHVLPWGMHALVSSGCRPDTKGVISPTVLVRIACAAVGAELVGDFAVEVVVAPAPTLFGTNRQRAVTVR